MAKPTVDDILDKETGEHFTAEQLLGKDKINQFKLRRDIEERIQKNISKYVCAICWQKIKLKMGDKNRFHFAHLKDSPQCPIKTDSGYSLKEWLAIIYHGAKESEAHIRLKTMLRDILEADSRFSNVKLEKTVKGLNEKAKWKKPDLQCMYGSHKHIFEIQISHTFISVIVAREIFYQENEMPLFWIFDEFKPEPDYIKAFQGDIFAHNNCNIMVFDNGTYRYSMKNKKFNLMVHWLEPYLENREIKTQWKCERVDFEKITYDDETYRAYYYDYERSLKLLEYKLKKELIFDVIKEDGNYSKRTDLFMERINDMGRFKLPSWFDKRDVYNLYDLFRVLMSIRDRVNYGYKNENPIWMLNLFYNSKKEFYWLVLKYIARTGYDEVLSNERKYPTFLKHNEEYEKSGAAKNNDYTDYLCWFFPELKDR